MYIGLDLGAGLAKIARYRTDAQNESGDGPSVTTIPSAVVYRGLSSEIPPAPCATSQPSGAVRCDGFAAMLDDAWPVSYVLAWGNRTAPEVTQTFLKCPLGGDDQRLAPKPGGFVVTVPPGPAQATAAGGPARSTGTELQEILTAIGLPPRRLVAAPIAALLHLRRRSAELASASSFVVCDIGAGSLSLSLCTAKPRGLRIADSIRLTGASAWSDDTLASAGTGERRPNLVECLVAALATASGGTSARITHATSVRRWRGLEHVLASEGQPDRLRLALQRASADRRRYGADTALRFADLEVTAGQLIDACAPLADQAAAALTRLLGRQAEPAWRRLGSGSPTRIVLIGGLSALRPVCSGLLAAAGLDPDQPAGAAVEPGGADRLGATALGAALVAAGQADIGDRYPHALRLPVHRAVRDLIESSDLELAAAGTIDLGQGETVLTPEDGEPVLVTVRAASGPAPLPVQVVLEGRGEPVPAEFQAAVPPPPGTYRVGVSVGPIGVAVVLHNVDGRAPLHYTLLEPAGLPEGHATLTAPSRVAPEDGA